MIKSLEELRGIISYARYTWFMGNRIGDKDFYDRATPENPPVLLLHGYLGTRGAMLPLELRLKRDGFAVFSVNLGLLNVADIRQSARRVKEKIERILYHVDLHQIDIVGHSMGGLIGLYFVKKLDGHRLVRKIVCIGSPFRGTWSAVVGVSLIGAVSPSSWQLLPDSFFINELESGPLPKGVEYHSIAGRRDLISPASRSRLRGALHHEVDCGHAALTNSHRVYRIARDILLSKRSVSEE